MNWILTALVGLLVYLPHPSALKHGWANFGGNEAYFHATQSNRWGFLIAIFTVSLGYRIGKRKHWSLGLFWTIAALSAVWLFSYHAAGVPNEWDNAQLKLGAAQSYAALVAVASALLWVRWTYDMTNTVEAVLGLMCMIETAVTNWQALIGMPAQFRGGLLGNPSLSGCFIAFTFPFLLLRPQARPDHPWDYEDDSTIENLARIGVWIGVIGAVLLKGTSQPIGAFVISFSAYHFAKRGWKEWTASLIGGAIAVSILVPLTTQKIHRSAFDDSDRFHVWSLVMKPWVDYGGVRSHLFGEGTGSTTTIMFHYQEEEQKQFHKPNEPFRAMYWDTMHNDYLQTLLENGVVGLLAALVCLAFGFALALKKSAHLFSAYVTYLACCVFNPTSHWPVHAAVGAIIAAMVFEPMRHWRSLDRPESA